MKDPRIEKILLKSLLPAVLKPGRYIGNELNTVHKDIKKIKSHVALAFPDVYEIGMSYIGFQLLYHILNQRRDIWAERVFAPWHDMEERLRKFKVPLYGLESFTPLSEFDVIGFTLQYELTYTNILNMLNLGGIPVWSSERGEDDPFIIAGGPCSCNPEPCADFIDAFLIGDGEEAAVEIIDAVRRGRENKKSREEILFDLCRIQGVYVPRFYEPVYDEKGVLLEIRPTIKGAPAVIRTRLVSELKADFYPDKPIIPLIEVTHDRLSLEVMRGCTEGCRFCNAGMIYRPVRERDQNDVLKQMQEGLANSGYNEVSFLSLSISDYSQLTELMLESRRALQNTQVSVSFPSMRLDSFSEQIADFVAQVRKSGFTFAPEAGSERLRRVINKNITEEDLFKSVEIALKNGWKLIKFYFMIGLPTETDEDVLEIAHLMNRLVKMSKQYGKAQFNVSVSPFSPKAHTPFQWERQNSIEEIWHKIDLLKPHLQKQRRIRLTWRDPDVSFLEGILGRADRRMGRVIYDVWKNGGKFDGWAEHFKFDLWKQVLKSHGYSWEKLTAEIPEDACLPWDHIDKGVTKNFLLKERTRAYKEQVSPDCKSDKCLACGLQRKGVFAELVDCYKKVHENVKPLSVEKTSSGSGKSPAPQSAENTSVRFRVQFKKEGYASFLSHLDLVRVFERVFRRAGVPLVYSQGFNPRPKISFGQPLALGIKSKAEFFDIEISADYGGDLKTQVNPYLPEGLKILRVCPIKSKTSSLSQAINVSEYEIIMDGSDVSLKQIDQTIGKIRRSPTLVIQRQRKGDLKSIDIRPFIDSIHRRGRRLIVRTKSVDRRSLRIDDFLKVLFKHSEQIDVIRKRQLIRSGKEEKTPLEVLS
ncbi:MAG: TIGR03960 family B12-binding radical SAM protein [Calditrichaeota bacterium]|nr:TIGR03960 family B12-binding radical SAM protein [Calditrichota bacterium]